MPPSETDGVHVYMYRSNGSLQDSTECVHIYQYLPIDSPNGETLQEKPALIASD